VNDFATPGVSIFLWNADDTSERYNAPDTVKVQWTGRLERGKVDAVGHGPRARVHHR
jgi:hypothetical protein